MQSHLMHPGNFSVTCLTSLAVHRRTGPRSCSPRCRVVGGSRRAPWAPIHGIFAFVAYILRGWMLFLAPRKPDTSSSRMCLIWIIGSSAKGSWRDPSLEQSIDRLLKTEKLGQWEGCHIYYILPNPLWTKVMVPFGSVPVQTLQTFKIPSAFKQLCEARCS